MSIDHVGVLGAGAWGSALANTAARAGRRVTLWARDERTVAAINEHHVTARLAAGLIEPSVVATADLGRTAQADAALLVVPAQAVRSVAAALKPLLADKTPVIVCAKGIERGSAKFMTDVVAEELPQAVPAILSGPSFADDVARGLPTAVTLAADDAERARTLALALGSTSFRPYHSTDVRGVEIGGAAKNVFAIAVGIAAGRKLGASAAAALTTRSFAELIRFGRAFGARIETLTGLSGLGDLVLTCSSLQSRNFALGVALGQGHELAQAQAGGKLAEGAFTASVLVELAQARGVEMPIASAVAAVLAGEIGIDDAIESLLMRPLRAEI